MTAKTVNERMAEYRARKRSAGHVQVTVWVPADRVDEIRQVAETMCRQPARKRSAAACKTSPGLAAPEPAKAPPAPPKPRSPVVDDERWSAEVAFAVVWPVYQNARRKLRLSSKASVLQAKSSLQAACRKEGVPFPEEHWSAVADRLRAAL